MFKIIDQIGNVDLASTCQVCKQHLDILNNPLIEDKTKPLCKHNLQKHLEFTHGIGCVVYQECYI